MTDSTSADDAQLVPFHAVPGGSGDVIEWTTPLLSQEMLWAHCPAGRVDEAESAAQLRKLKDEDVISSASVARPLMADPRGSVTTRLGTAFDRRRDSARIRAAVREFLQAVWQARPEQPEAGEATDVSDEVLAAAAQDALRGEVGQFAATHGGSIDYVTTSGGTVVVRMRGACRGCPASMFTLQKRLADAVQRRCGVLPDIRER